MSNWRTLRRQRPKSRLIRISAGLFVLASACAWLFGNLQYERMFSARCVENASRFAQRVVPLPIRKADGDWGQFAPWLSDLLLDRGLAAMATTLGISIAAIVLAFVFANSLMPFASRNLMAPHPFLKGTHPANPIVRVCWGSLVWLTRGFFVFTRAIPEYVFAFLLVGLLGANAWPAVLALALHNVGILGRLGAETVENTPADIPMALRVAGASRRQIMVLGLFPITLPRLLVFFFYRWETCVREATIIGMLGIVSLGFYITDARARIRYDDLLAFIVLGAVLVIAGDLVSGRVRRWIRNAG